MKLIMTLVAGICIGMAVVLAVSSNPFSPKNNAPLTPPVAEIEKSPAPAPVKKVEMPPARTMPGVSARPPVAAPIEKDEESIRPVTVLKIEQPKAPAADPQDSVKTADKIRARTMAATVLLHMEQQGKLYEACGVYCAPGVIAASARILGFDLRARELPANVSIKALSYGAEPSINVARVVAYDPETALIFLTVPERSTSPEPLELGEGTVASNALVYIPRFSHGGGQKPEIETGRVGNVWSDPNGLHSFVSIDSEFGAGSAGAPCVDCEGRLVAIAGQGHDESLKGLTIHCDAVRVALKGRLGAVYVRKTDEHDGLYSFEVAVESLDPAERIRAAFFYYWTIKPAIGTMKSDNMIRNRLTRAGSSQWIGEVKNVKLPAGSKIWIQTGFALTGRQVEILSDPFECAIGLGVPNAPIVAAVENEHRPLAKVEAVPRGEEAPFAFVGTQPTVETVESITTTTVNGTTVTQTVVTNAPPAPPPDSPGWTFGYKTDWSTNHKSGGYEEAPSYSRSHSYYNNYFQRPLYMPSSYYNPYATPIYTQPTYTTTAPRYYLPVYSSR